MTDSSQATKPTPESRLLGTVYEIDKQDIYLTLEGMPDDVLAHFSLAKFGYLQLTEGQKLRVRVLSISDTTPPEAECEPLARQTTPEGFKTGEITDFGGPDAPYGHILPDDGSKEVFIHQDEAPGLTLIAGMRIMFKEIRGKKGKPTATEVSILPQE